MVSIYLGPILMYWQPDLCQPALSHVYIFVTLSLNIITDIYLILIPIPMLWRAWLPTIKKLGLVLLFSGAIFVTVAGVLRCILILQVSTPMLLCVLQRTLTHSSEEPYYRTEKGRGVGRPRVDGGHRNVQSPNNLGLDTSETQAYPLLFGTPKWRP